MQVTTRDNTNIELLTKRDLIEMLQHVHDDEPVTVMWGSINRLIVGTKKTDVHQRPATALIAA